VGRHLIGHPLIYVEGIRPGNPERAAQELEFITLGSRHYDTPFITDLVMNIGAPCLVFASLAQLEMAAGPLLTMVGATLASLVCFFAIGGLALRLAGLPVSTYVGPLAFGNSGNMGLPLCLFAFGAEGLAFAVCFFATTAIAHYTVGQWIWSGKISFRQLARTPLVYAVFAGLMVIRRILMR